MMKKKTNTKSFWQDVAQDKKVQISKLNFASWNIRTMLDRENTERPERRSAIISSELQKYGISIAALSKVRFKNTFVKSQATPFIGVAKLQLSAVSQAWLLLSGTNLFLD